MDLSTGSKMLRAGRSQDHNSHLPSDFPTYESQWDHAVESRPGGAVDT